MRAVVPASEARRGITKLRAGPPKRITLIESPTAQVVDIVPTFHPAACLRSQQNFPLMVDDIGKAIATDKPSLWYEPTIKVIDDPREAIELMQSITELNYRDGVVVDTESGRDKDVSFGRDDGPYGRVLCIGIGSLDYENGDTVYVFTDDALAWTDSQAAMRNMLNDCGIIAQNGKYDIGVLMDYLNQTTPFPLKFDTMLASYCMNENGGIHGLKYMGQEILGTPDWDSVIKPFITKDLGYGSIPRDMLYKYNAFDVHVTRLLYGYFSAFIEERGLTQLNELLLKYSYMLTQVEARGMGFNLAKSRELEAEYDAEIEKIDATLPFNPRSPKQVLSWFESRDINIGTTGEDHLRAFVETYGDKVSPDVTTTVDGILASRKVSKLRGTYVTGLQKRLTKRGTVHPSFLIHGTNTGRLSSRNPNAQNIPRSGEIKKQFIPSDPRRVMVQNDYSQAELRVLTWMAKEEGLRVIFNDPSRDVFDDICRDMFPDFDGMDADQRKELRTLVKTFAYGISYGRTARGIADDPDFHMSLQQAEMHMATFQARIPNIMTFMQEQVIDRIHEGHDLVNPFGRHKRFWLLTDMNKNDVHREAMSYYPQSTASDMCLRAACRANDLGIHIVNLIHDAVLFEALPDEAQEQAELVNQLMVESAHDVVGDYVRFTTEYKIGPDWYTVR